MSGAAYKAAASLRIRAARARGESASVEDLSLFPCACVVNGETCRGHIGPDVMGLPMCYRCGPSEMRPPEDAP